MMCNGYVILCSHEVGIMVKVIFSNLGKSQYCNAVGSPSWTLNNV